jgi:hypothetical protein
MTRPDAEGGPATTPNRLHKTQALPPAVTLSVPGGSVNQAVADKLWWLHWNYGYFTRAKIEAALGLDPPRGEWACPGQFGADGTWAPCCQETAA